VIELCRVFIKVVFKNQKEDGTRQMHYRMVESYRVDNTVKHQNILYLGTLESLPKPSQKKSLGRRIDELVKNKTHGSESMFQDADAEVEALAQRYAEEIFTKFQVDTEFRKEYQSIDTQSVKNDNVRELGGEWLCYQTLEQLKLRELLMANQWDNETIQLAYTHIISRSVYPASEFSTNKWIKENSSVCELTGYDLNKITKDKLYGISKELYKLKDEIESHLSTTTNELFDLTDNILIYDLTNTYFEGKMNSSAIAKRGHSKEKRSDAKLIVLAVVINAEGFIKYSNIFEGNTNDSTTILKIIGMLSERTAHLTTKPVVVMDAGIASEDNLTLLKKLGYSYMCVSRSGMTKYQIDTQYNPIQVSDKSSKPITLQRVTIPKKDDQYVLVHSEAKEAKERSMNDQAKKRFEIGLQQIQSSLTKKGGVKTIDKVYERIGRLKQSYQGIHRYYTVTCEYNEKLVTKIHWELKNQTSSQNMGKYLLRTTLNLQNEKTQWIIYNAIREIETTFRILKTDLDLRPIYHKTDEASMAHLHLGLLSYWVVNTVRYQLKQNNITHHWTELMRIMHTQKLVTTKMNNNLDQIIEIRKASEPIDQVKRIYQALKYKSKPFLRKSVVPQPILLNNQLTIYQDFNSV